MNVDLLKYYLIRGLPIPYKGINIIQPTLNIIDKLKFNLATFENYKLLYCASKEVLNIDSETSYFECILSDKNLFSLLLDSLQFFLNITFTDENIEIIENSIIIFNMQKEPILILNDDNFEEFSTIIRTICYCEKITIENEEDKYRVKEYKNEVIRKKMEEALQRIKEKDKKEKEESRMCFADIINTIIVSKFNNYDLLNISNLTVWMIYNIYSNSFLIEGNEFLKQRFCSYKFEFKDNPNFEWTKKSKPTINEDIIKIQ